MGVKGNMINVTQLSVFFLPLGTEASRPPAVRPLVADNFNQIAIFFDKAIQITVYFSYFRKDLKEFDDFPYLSMIS